MMHSEVSRAGRPLSRRLLRVDEAAGLRMPAAPSIFGPALAVAAAVLVLAGAANLDLGPADGRAGLALWGPIAPLGIVAGSWAPDLWPGQILAGHLASLFAEGGRPTSGSILWPAALAAAAIGIIQARRVAGMAGPRAGLIAGLCWFGSIGVIDHSGGIGLDFLSGLAIVAAFDRLLSRGSDWVAGAYTALAFLCGGWPPVLLVFLAVLVVGRREAGYSPRLIVPPLAAAVAWGAWMLAVGSAEVVAAALALPFTLRPDWMLAIRVLALGLPFAPLALLGAWRPVRERWGVEGSRLATGWLQASLACLVVGTVVPGLSQAARVPSMAGLLLLAAMGADAAWARVLPGRSTRAFGIFGFGLPAVWLMITMYGGYLWLVVFPYYRPVGVAGVILGLTAMALGWLAVEQGNSRRGLLALVILSATLKLVHWGYYVPEWNYRHGQGPWGRAIGQWLLPNWTLYTFHDWPEDLLFAVGRPVRQLRSPQHLTFEEPGRSKHVLLLEAEFDHWPADAPPLFRVAMLQDPSGSRRILARTAGKLVTPLGNVYSHDTNPQGDKPDQP